MDGRRGLKDRRLRSMTKCHMCGKKFMTVQALRSHESVHKARAKTSIKNKLGSRVVKQKPAILQRKLVVEKTETVKTVEETMKQTKIEFMCPKCSLSFPHYFQAIKHIQKTHCVDSKDEPVSPGSPNIIKPILTEKCGTCAMAIHSEPHTCLEKDDISIFKCLGCSQVHYSQNMFDQHVSRMHSDGLESMFFPSESDFQSWKDDMVYQTKATYSTVKDHNEKHIYKCNHQEMADGVRIMCPSTMITQKFANGIQVHFYKKHIAHSVKAYHIGFKFKKFSITNFVKVNNTRTSKIKESNVNSDGDLYLQFKNLMEGIVVDAAKINITSLKILLEKAYEMTLVLNDYNEDAEHDVPMDRPLMDDQITLALQEKNGKRKLDSPPEVIEKKKKAADAKSTAVKVKKKIELKMTLVKPKEEIVVKEEAEEVEEPNELVTSTPMPKPQMLISSPSSFNDSYKNFVDNNFKVDGTPKAKPLAVQQKTPTQTRKKQIVKTKIGQFKPNILSPKKTVSPTSKQDVKFRDVTEVEYEVKERDNDCNILILKF